MGSTDSIRPVGSEPYDYFPLDTHAGVSLLPDEHELVVNRLNGHVTLVNWELRRFLAECGFTDEELPLMLILLEAWPSYISYENMLALVSEDTPEEIARRVDAAREAETLGEVLTPLRVILKACQERMNLFGIQIAAVYRYGYLLIPLSSMRSPEHQSL